MLSLSLSLSPTVPIQFRFFIVSEFIEQLAPHFSVMPMIITQVGSGIKLPINPPIQEELTY